MPAGKARLRRLRGRAPFGDERHGRAKHLEQSEPIERALDLIVKAPRPERLVERNRQDELPVDRADPKAGAQERLFDFTVAEDPGTAPCGPRAEQAGCAPGNQLNDAPRCDFDG